MQQTHDLVLDFLGLVADLLGLLADRIPGLHELLDTLVDGPAEARSSRRSSPWVDRVIRAWIPNLGTDPGRLILARAGILSLAGERLANRVEAGGQGGILRVQIDEPIEMPG